MAKILKSEAAIALWRQGKDKWNEWAKEHKGWGVSFEGYDFTKKSQENNKISFKGFVFPGVVSFERATFCEGDVDFREATFGVGDVNFRETTFGEGIVSFREATFGVGDVNFSRATFGEGIVNFSETTFGVGDVRFYQATFREGYVSFYQATFDEGDVDFSGTTFGEGNVDFSRATFGEGYVDFSGATFGEGYVYFSEITFGGVNVYFRGCNILGHFKMDRTVFDNCSASFSGSQFEKSVNFSNTDFSNIPNFLATKFSHHVVISDMKITYPKLRFNQSKNSYKSNDAVKIRRLKELASHAKDHDLELEFFIEELKAKRGYETKGIKLFINLVYGLFSDFGRSILRPVVSIVALWFSFGWFYTLLSPKENIIAGLNYSATKLGVFIPYSKQASIAFEEKLYTITPDIVQHLAVFESFLSTAFFALMLLAIRNRFKLK